ncbi:ASST-domain-containing protein [Ilyonectria robusta]|uniref:ASST-domain-containing protein n=1 Tax=Ilyonectria robusta TaxID=1079257 RepID=UPI001E8CAE87|nr:ASST-domain-containing protein [Ilyonectria robusta]KAH8694810.1 ASST-domain-containing protein [Ilyonectria robusta]
MHTRFLLLAAASLMGACLVSADAPFFNDLNGFNQGLLGRFPNQTFRSTDIIAPLFQVNTFRPDLVDEAGYIFLTIEFDGRGGPAIFSSKDLSLVYADLNYARSFDARAQDRNGITHLTFIENGDCHVFNDSYQKQFSVTAKGLGRTTRADLHEFQFTGQGTAIMSVYQDIKYNMTAVGGDDNGLLTDAIFEEVELENNQVLNLWRASNHFNLSDTYVKYGPDKGFMNSDGFDWFHIDSIYKSRYGDYLISSRALSMIALLNGESGNPKWILGGKHNQFKDLSGGNATKFANQHNARFVQRNESQISFFDNHVLETGPCNHTNCSRGVVVELDYDAMTAQLLGEFRHPQKVSSGSQGSVQALKNGNFLVGWGLNPGFTEHFPNGTVVMDVQRGAFPKVAGVEPGADMTVYRAWKMNWVGRPQWGPDIASVSQNNMTTNATFYVSWNGNTEVDRWEVYVGNDPMNITLSHERVGNSTRMGFETMIVLDGKHIPRYARAAAFDKHGEAGKEQSGSQKAEEPESNDGKPTAVKEPGPLARRLEEATEEALFTGGRAGRRAIEDAGFSKELKEKLLSKIADANFRTQYSGAFTEADMPAAAGEGTRHIATGQPWTGQEPIGDGVLRMLDDAKKPLGPGLRSKFQPPPVDMRLQRGPSKSAGEKVATARDRASMYTGMDMKSKNGLTEEERERYRKELKERFEPGFRAMPNTISGLAGLANERIENAIARGQFKNIPRGPGIERDARADNPFIDTTEYIMNKMIQRQDLVPPWIEKQQELVKAVRVFRARLRNDWKRHAARMIASKGGSLLDQMRRAEAYAAAEQVHNPRVRGQKKEQATTSTPVAEKSYLGLAVEELNRLTRSYNLMAPDLAKKGYFSLDRELRACFADVAPEVAKEIQVRALGGTVRSRGLRGGLEGRDGDGDSIGGSGGILERMSGGKRTQVHVEAEKKAYGLKEWWNDVWKKD